jgi:amidase
MEEIIFASAKSMARAIRDKEASSVEVVEAHLRRIDEVNPKLNAVVQLAGDRALAEARAADDSLSRGESKGPLHGVPMTVKDSHDTEGIVSTAGTTGRASFVPDRDATTVARMRAAGAIVLGKTNTPELTLSFETDNLVYGRTNNPYDLSRTPGGSSGGAAAIIASGGSPLDLGTDTGGSIRVPAGFCGIAGLKPTSGRVPRTGHIIHHLLGATESLTTVGPLARFVEDLALVLPIIAGPDWTDPAIVPMPVDDPASVDLSNMRVASFADNGTVSPTAEVVAAVEAAANALRDAGAAVTEDMPPAIAKRDELRMLTADGGAGIQRLLDAAGTTRPHPRIERMAGAAEAMEVGDYTAMLEEVDAFRSEMLGFMENYDALLCPVRPFPALPHGESMSREMSPSGSYTSAFNTTGWPGAVVRAGTSPEGMPIGVQLITRPWTEAVALALAQVVETALGGWRKPPI